MEIVLGALGFVGFRASGIFKKGVMGGYIRRVWGLGCGCSTTRGPITGATVM